jgi:hypothetical protein
VQVDHEEKAPMCSAFAKPSDELEPSTPSSPFDARGNQSQPMATDLACFSGFSSGGDLPLIATGCDRWAP